MAGHQRMISKQHRETSLCSGFPPPLTRRVKLGRFFEVADIYNNRQHIVNADLSDMRQPESRLHSFILLPSNEHQAAARVLWKIKRRILSVSQKRIWLVARVRPRRNTPMGKSTQCLGSREGFFGPDRLSEALRGKVREMILSLAEAELSEVLAALPMSARWS